MKARVMYTDASVELEPASVSMYFDAESVPTDIDSEEEGSVSNCPAADSSATMIGGSILKRPCVELGEANQVLVENLNPGQDSSANGTIEEVKGGGSVLNKDLGGSSEVVVNNLNPGSADSFVDASSDT